MKHKRIEFGIETATLQDKLIIVAGRCYQGPISIGDSFDLIYTVEPVLTPSGYGPSTRGPEREVALRVETLWAYGHFLEELDTGLTAELTLSGRGGELLRPGAVLGVKHLANHE